MCNHPVSGIKLLFFVSPADPNNQARVQPGGMGPGVGMGGPSSSAVGGPSGSQVMNMRPGGMGGAGAGFGMQTPSGHQGKLGVGLVGYI